MTDTDNGHRVFSGAEHARPELTTPDLRFGPAPGNTMSPPWAAHMLTLWFQAGSGKLPFADAVKATAVHFMVEGES